MNFRLACFLFGLVIGTGISAGCSLFTDEQKAVIKEQIAKDALAVGTDIRSATATYYINNKATIADKVAEKLNSDLNITQPSSTTNTDTSIESIK